MNFHQSIFQNNNLKIIKYLSLIILIFVLSFKANTEIPEKYMDSELSIELTHARNTFFLNI